MENEERIDSFNRCQMFNGLLNSLSKIVRSYTQFVCATKGHEIEEVWSISNLILSLRCKRCKLVLRTFIGKKEISTYENCVMRDNDDFWD